MQPGGKEKKKDLGNIYNAAALLSLFITDLLTLNQILKSSSYSQIQPMRTHVSFYVQLEFSYLLRPCTRRWHWLSGTSYNIFLHNFSFLYTFIKQQRPFSHSRCLNRTHASDMHSRLHVLSSVAESAKVQAGWGATVKIPRNPVCNGAAGMCSSSVQPHLSPVSRRKAK